jgi:hypothetical protein
MTLSTVKNTRIVDSGANLYSTQLRLDDYELRTMVHIRPMLHHLAHICLVKTHIRLIFDTIWLIYTTIFLLVLEHGTKPCTESVNDGQFLDPTLKGKTGKHLQHPAAP